MAGTFFGINNAANSLSLNQALLDLVNNNIANVNTPGYSKQRAEISQLTSGKASVNPQEAVQDCLGAIITDISRNRDLYLDGYYREENADLAYYKELAESADLIEDIINEIDNIGINKALNDFYESLSQLANNADDYVTRSVVVQKAMELSTKFNSIYRQLSDMRENLVGDYTDPTTLDSSKIKIITDDLNNKLSSIAELNHQIILSSTQGQVPNYLLDQRDKMLDQISEYLPLDITNESNGSVTVALGNTIVVSGSAQSGVFSVTTGDIDNPVLLQIENGTGGVLVSDAYSMATSGKVGAILQMGGSASGDLTVKSVMDGLDTLAFEFANAMNTLQTGGQYMTENPVGSGVYELTTDHDLLNPPVGPPNFFVDDAAAGTAPVAAAGFAGIIAVNDTIVNDPYQVSAADAASTAQETGDGANALLMAQLRLTTMAGLGGATTEQYTTDFIGGIGSKANTINTNHNIKDNVTQQIKMKRETVIGVNLDEEMTDLIRFQRSYEAAARIFKVMDENIKTILGML